MAKKQVRNKSRRPARKSARKSAPKTYRLTRKEMQEFATNQQQLGAMRAGLNGSVRIEPANVFTSLDSPEPGQVHIRSASIEVISHPVQKIAGGEYVLYVTLASGQKTVILDTPENRTALDIPLQPPDLLPRAGTPPPRGPRHIRRPMAPARIAEPQADPLVKDEDDHPQ